MSRRITIVGAGVSVSTFLDVLAARPDVGDLHVHVVGRREDRLATVRAHLAERLARSRPSWEVSGGTSLEHGLRGAEVVVTMLRVGGAAARAHDETFPARFGFVGDEGVGVGGIANAWRTLRVIERVGRTIREVAPAATVLNLVAPLGQTTRVLADQGLRALGICELPSVTLDRLSEHLPAPAPHLEVGGLNHLSWIWSRDAGDELHAAALAAGLVDEDTWRCYGAVPMPYFYRVLHSEAGRRLGVRQPPGRAAELDELATRALERMRAEPGATVRELAARATPWFDRALVPVIAALLGGEPHRGHVDVPCDGLLAGLPAEVVVEVPATFDVDGAHPEGCAPPERVLAFLRSWAEVEQRSHLAATTRDRGLLRDAVTALPQVPDAASSARRAAVVDGLVECVLAGEVHR